MTRLFIVSTAIRGTTAPGRGRAVARGGPVKARLAAAATREVQSTVAAGTTIQEVKVAKARGASTTNSHPFAVSLLLGANQGLVRAPREVSMAPSGPILLKGWPGGWG